MSQIKIFNNKIIETSLENNDRQYLVGNLTKPQFLKHIIDKNVEIGISDYQIDTLDKPHFHTTIAEYQYILEGEIILFDLDKKESYKLKKGDFYSIPKHVQHVQVSKAHSRILFVKNKSINDKNVITVSNDIYNWIYQTCKEENQNVK